jgi:hypothetical protein
MEASGAARMQREAVAAGAACVSRCWSSVRRRLPELLVQREAVAVGAARDSCRWGNEMLRLLDPLVTVAARSARPRLPEQPGCVGAEAARCRSSRGGRSSSDQLQREAEPLRQPVQPVSVANQLLCGAVVVGAARVSCCRTSTSQRLEKLWISRRWSSAGRLL